MPFVLVASTVVVLFISRNFQQYLPTKKSVHLPWELFVYPALTRPATGWSALRIMIWGT
jgi:hypothetical protein